MGQSLQWHPSGGGPKPMIDPTGTYLLSQIREGAEEDPHAQNHAEHAHRQGPHQRLEL